MKPRYEVRREGNDVYWSDLGVSFSPVSRNWGVTHWSRDVRLVGRDGKEDTVTLFGYTTDSLDRQERLLHDISRARGTRLEQLRSRFREKTGRSVRF